MAPRTREEELLAAVWAQVLRLPRVGVHDNFFELGGDSILSIQIVARARQAGLLFSMRQIFEHPDRGRAGLAVVTEAAAAGQGPVVGEVPLTPVQRWFLEQDFADPHHFNQTLRLEPREPLAPPSWSVPWPPSWSTTTPCGCGSILRRDGRKTRRSSR